MKVNRILSLLLCTALIFALFPRAAHAAVSVSYLDAEGVEQFAEAQAVTSSTTTLSGSGATNGWYVVQSTANIVLSSTVAVSGNVHLILEDGGKLTITGSTDRAGIALTDASLTIYGQANGTGELHATGGSGGAGIGGDAETNNNNGGELTVNGGRVYATGVGGGAGIGGGKGRSTSSASSVGGSGGTVTINAGTVDATGSVGGAGIGGGAGGDGRNGDHGGNGGTVKVYGGTLIARSAGGGAGIGGGLGGKSGSLSPGTGGNGGSGGTFTLHNGIVDAQGSSNAWASGGAGIGGGAGGVGLLSEGKAGAGGAGSTVTIYSGTLKAEGGYNGAGIGGGCGGGSGGGMDEGNGGAGGTTTIYGGTVVAYGNKEGTGIGGGSAWGSARGGSGGTVTIAGGSVRAAGGDTYIASIGGGRFSDSNGSLKNAEGTNVHLTTVTLQNLTTETAITSLITDATYDYGISGMHTDENGMLYLYLPEGTQTTAVQTTDGAASPTFTTYAGSVTTANDHSAKGTLLLQGAVTAPGILTSTLSNGIQGYAYSQALSASGTAPITWEVLTGSLPTGLALNPSTGLISGTPSETGDFDFTAKATNAAGSTTMALRISIHSGAALTPANGTFDIASPTDLNTTIVWNGASEITGITLDGVALTPTMDYTVSGSTLTVGCSYFLGLHLTAPDTLDFQVNFNAGIPAQLNVAITNSFVPSADADLSTLTVGGNEVVGFDPAVTVYSVQLPYGTTPGSAAARLGATAQSAEASVRITQAASLPGNAFVEVTAQDGTTTKTYTVNLTLAPATPTAPSIVTSNLARGVVNTPYSQILSANGSIPMLWEIADGSLPLGINLNAHTGLLSGTPATVGTFAFTVKATNAEGSDFKLLQITVASAVPVVQTLADDATGILLTGAISPGATLTVTNMALDEGAASNAIRLWMNDNSRTLLSSMDISLSGNFSGSLTLSIPVGSAYNGQTVTVLHAKRDGTLETYIVTVQNGCATFMVTSLSPFAVFLGGESTPGVPLTGGGGFAWFFGSLCGLSAAAFFTALKKRKKA